MAEGRPDGWPDGALDAGELLAAVRTGEVSVEEVVVARLARLHDLDEVTAAIAAFEDDRALADARALDRTRAEGRPLGPLHGLPVTVKDWIDVEGFPCAGEGGRAIGRRPSVDATVVGEVARHGCGRRGQDPVLGRRGAGRRGPPPARRQPDAGRVELR